MCLDVNNEEQGSKLVKKNGRLGKGLYKILYLINSYFGNDKVSIFKVYFQYLIRLPSNQKRLCFTDARLCRCCKRHLRKDLFNLGSDRCFACVRKGECLRKYKRYDTSINGTFLRHRIIAGLNAVDPIIYFQSIVREIVETLQHGLELHASFRWVLSASVIFERTVEDNLQETRFDFNSDEQVLLRADQIGGQVETAMNRLLALLLEMSERDSDFVFKRVYFTTVRLARYNPIGGSSFIPTPKELADKHALINVQNEDSLCFLYAIASAIHPAKRNPNRPSHYVQYLSEFNITGLKFPLDPKDISKFEELNPSIAVNVLHYDEDRTIDPLVASSHFGREH